MIEQTLKNEFMKITGYDNSFDKKEDLICYSYDGTNKEAEAELVLKPKTTEEVSRILKLANLHNIGVTPRGAGTGLSGGSLPTEGKIVLVLTGMNKIIEVNTDDLYAIVEPGVVTGDFHREVEKTGLFYPPDPASLKMCTLGGNVSECAGGPRCLKYGVTRDYILGLEVVTSDGDILNTGGKVIKNVSGYDITSLLVGSEGTLAVITKIIAKLIPFPKHNATILSLFKTPEDAAYAVSTIIAKGVLPSILEFMDNKTIVCVEDYLKIGLPTEAGALLLIEVDGNLEQCKSEEILIKELCMSCGAFELQTAKNSEERENLWKARRAIMPALGKISPIRHLDDIVVPRSKLPELVSNVNELALKFKLETAAFGHAGDGNLHLNVFLKEHTDDERSRLENYLELLYSKTLELSGTVSGEHGIGSAKKKYLLKEKGEKQINLMKAVKSVFDPKGILNPGKIF